MELYNNSNKAMVIYPWEKDQVSFLTKKWKISDRQLNDAILETGSINRAVIKQYLIQKGVILSFGRIARYLKVNYFSSWD